MKGNRVLERWRAGKVALGGWLAIPSAFSAEIMAYRGFDYICLDMQHGVIDYQVAVTMIQAINATDVTPFVRVPGNDFAIINRMLDAGAMGVIVPLVNTAEEAQRAVDACRYPPLGSRSIGPTRVSIGAGPDYAETANSQIVCIPMIETSEAVQNLEEILDVPGIEAIYVGPSDLSLSLNMPPGLDNGGVFEEARLRVAQVCRERQVVAGIHAEAALTRKHANAGFRMITVSVDFKAMLTATDADLLLARESLELSEG